MTSMGSIFVAAKAAIDVSIKRRRQGSSTPSRSVTRKYDNSHPRHKYSACLVLHLLWFFYQPKINTGGLIELTMVLSQTN